jgi:Insulinase (Peptidase family M16)
MRLCVELGSGPKLPAVIDVTLMHPVQHMLFLGTEKYPDENSYSAFLNQHGGNSNAYTASEYTNYYFDVQAQEALDRFSQFFVAPLFTPSATERELKASCLQYFSPCLACHHELLSRRLWTLSIPRISRMTCGASTRSGCFGVHHRSECTPAPLMLVIGGLAVKQDNGVCRSSLS